VDRNYLFSKKMALSPLATEFDPTKSLHQFRAEFELPEDLMVRDEQDQEPEPRLEIHGTVMNPRPCDDCGQDNSIYVVKIDHGISEICGTCLKKWEEVYGSADQADCCIC
jgi:hypothetical protein